MKHGFQSIDLKAGAGKPFLRLKKKPFHALCFLLAKTGDFDPKFHKPLKASVSSVGPLAFQYHPDKTMHFGAILINLLLPHDAKKLPKYRNQ